jgi:hypothetical protein
MKHDGKNPLMVQHKNNLRKSKIVLFHFFQSNFCKIFAKSLKNQHFKKFRNAELVAVPIAEVVVVVLFFQ